MNPYVEAQQRALVATGQVRFLPTGDMSVGELRRFGSDLDVVHLHWLEFLYSADGGLLEEKVRATKRAAQLLSALAWCRHRGVRVVWTVHNLHPHERRHPLLERLTTRATLRAADALTFHSAHAASAFAAVWREHPATLVVPHPNYKGFYPEPSATREQLRQRAGYGPDDVVLLQFGQVRPYKRIPELVRAVCAAAEPRLRLHVAGAAKDADLVADIERAAVGDARVRLEIGTVEAGRVTDLHALADVTVINYADVFSSGVLMLSLSFGRPVLGPTGTTIDEIAEPPAVIAFDTLQDGLRRAAALPADGGTAASTAADRYSWARMAHELLEAYGLPTAAPLDRTT